MLGDRDGRTIDFAATMAFAENPYGLAYHRGSLYLVGRNPQREQVCHWKVDRIEQAAVDAIHFQRPEGFDLDDFRG